MSGVGIQRKLRYGSCPGRIHSPAWSVGGRDRRRMRGKGKKEGAGNRELETLFHF